jgi:hypothetical protein
MHLFHAGFNFPVSDSPAVSFHVRPLQDNANPHAFRAANKTEATFQPPIKVSYVEISGQHQISGFCAHQIVP